MKEFSENKRNEVMDDQDDLARDATLFNPINVNDDEDDEELDDEEDDDLDEFDEDVDQDINNEQDDEDPDRRKKGDQSDIPPEFPDRRPEHNYTTPQAGRNPGVH